MRSFADIDESFMRPGIAPPETIMKTWVLLYHIDEQQQEIRTELSLPEYMAEDGHVTAWRKRIILEPIPLAPTPAPSDSDDEMSDEEEIAVQRRAG